MKKQFIFLLVSWVSAVFTAAAQSSSKAGPSGQTGSPADAPLQSWLTSVEAPSEAPNIVWILLDDIGFGAISTFGGLIETPTLDSLAAQGLRFTNFHTIGICAPTRAALLTGRNHHSVHMGLFPDNAVGTPGYDALIPFEKGTAAEVLRENGYNTYALGKWHITPIKDLTPAGPFHRWPTGRGFDQFYGFPSRGSIDQWHPELFEGTVREPDRQDGKHFNELIFNKAISYIGQQKSANPGKPFFLYIAPGAGHSPHQVDQVWIDQYRGKFDEGWDVYREKVIANQKKMGIIPTDTRLPDRNPGIVAWNTLSSDQKRLYTRLMEAYAGFLTYTDREIGRLIAYIRQLGQLENTLVIISVGDNGASKEGTLDGIVNNYGPNVSREASFARALSEIDLIGTEYAKNNFPLGWAAATNTPFKLWKQDANSEGGTRNPLIIFYPKKIRDKGGIRHQYGHVIDILPTTLELAGLKTPDKINGYAQEPFEGISLAYTIDNQAAPSRHVTQYYEVKGSRSIYHDGWKAGTLHKAGEDFDKDVWELYNLNEDYNELVNLADKHPEKLRELRELFEEQARKYNVYPLKDLSTSIPRRTAFDGLREVKLYGGISTLPDVASPLSNKRSFSASADAVISEGTEGVLFSRGGRDGGYSFYIQNNQLAFTYNIARGNSITVTSAEPVPVGPVLLKVVVGYRGHESGDITLFIGDKKVAHGQFGATAVNPSYHEGLNLGLDDLTPVSESYRTPFKFTGILHSVTFHFPDISENTD